MLRPHLCGEAYALSVLVVGSVALDTVETPVARVTDALGGAATYASIAAALLCPEVAVVAVVGTDFAQRHVELLRGRGVDVSGVRIVEGSTFRWSGRYHADMMRRDTLSTELNVFATFEPRLSERHRDAQYVFLANIQPTLQLSVLQQVRSPELILLDTMNYWILSAKQPLLEAIRQSDLLFLNDEEAHQLTGCTSLHAAGESLLAMGPRCVVIKKGEHGANLYQADGLFLCPAYPVPIVVDPTGAGDAFAGGCVGYLASCGDTGPESLRRAVAYGAVIASFCVEGLGTEGLLRADRGQVCKRYAELRNAAAMPES